MSKESTEFCDVIANVRVQLNTIRAKRRENLSQELTPEEQALMGLTKALEMLELRVYRLEPLDD